MRGEGAIGPAGTLGLRKFHRWPSAPRLLEILRDGFPRPGLQPGVAMWRLQNLPNLWRGLWKVLACRLLRAPHFYGVLYLDLIKADGTRIALGLASMRVVTDAGAGYLVDALQNLVEAENMKFHGFGTGSTAEAAGNTALVTELTTEYAVDNTRPTGSQTENGAQVYRTVATLDPDVQVLAREHGIFSEAATGGGVLLDRSVYALVTVEGAGDTLQATYDFTINSGN